jgi:hypothetical protein
MNEQDKEFVLSALREIRRWPLNAIGFKTSEHHPGWYICQCGKLAVRWEDIEHGIDCPVPGQLRLVDRVIEKIQTA